MREVPEKYVADIADVEPNRPYAINHGLRTADVIWQLREIATGEIVRSDRHPIDEVIEGPDQLTLTLPASLAGKSLRVVVIG